MVVMAIIFPETKQSSCDKDCTTGIYNLISENSILLIYQFKCCGSKLECN